MWTRILLIVAILIGGGWVASPPVQAGCVVETTGTYAEGVNLRDVKCDTGGNQKVSLAGSSGGGLGTATAAAPTLVEGAASAFSFDLAGNARFTLGTLLAGEDQTNNLIMTNGGTVKVWAVTWASAASTTTNATSDTFLIGSGGKTPMASVTGTGAQTATVNIYGDMTNTTTNGEWICSMELSGTTTDVKVCPQFTKDFPYYHAATTAITGTNATVVVSVTQGAVGVRNPRFKISGVKTADALIKTGPGILRCLIISEHDAAPTAGTISVNDATSAGTGTVLFEWILTTAVFTPLQVCPEAPFTTGLYFDFTTVADVNVSATYE